MTTPRSRRLRATHRAVSRACGVVVAGDLVADEFIYGQIDRVSREAPVLILQYDSTEIVPGGAGNAAQQRRGARRAVDVVGVVGRDDAGPAAARRAAGARRSSRRRAGVRRTSRRSRRAFSPAACTRPSSRSCGSIAPGSAADAGAIAARRSARWRARSARADAVILSDYGSGPGHAGRSGSARSRPRGVKTTADRARRFALRPRRIHAASPRARRTSPKSRRCSASASTTTATCSSGPGAQLLEQLRCRAVLITRGSRGMALFEPGRPTDHIPIVGSDRGRRRHGRRRHRHRDVRAGAGRRRDVRRGGAAGQLRGRPRRHEARHRHRQRRPNLRRGRACRPTGAADGDGSSPTPNSSSRRGRSRGRPDRRVRQRLFRPAARRPRPLPRRAPAREADRLVVAVNDDASVRRLKGAGPAGHAGEPRAPNSSRRCAASTTSCCFRDATVERLLRLLKPDVHCKGTDYTVDTVPEREVVRAYGGRIAIVGDPKDHSTRELLAQIAAERAERRRTRG